MKNIIIPGLLKKKISFRRLTAKNIIGYEVYGEYKDSTQSNGIRKELIDTIDNPQEPSLYLKKIQVEPNIDATWELPNDAYLDRDHHFRIYVNGVILSQMCYKYNRITRLITLDILMKEYHVTDTIEIEYYQDLIVKEYMLENDCIIKIKPIFTHGYVYGDHNIII